MKQFGGSAVVVGVFGPQHSPHDPLDRLAVMHSKPWFGNLTISFPSGRIKDGESIEAAAARIAEREVHTVFCPERVEIWSENMISHPHPHFVTFAGVEVPSASLPHPGECGTQGEVVHLVGLYKLLKEQNFLRRHRDFFEALRERA